MKTSVSFLISILLSVEAMCAVLTVSNNPLSPGQYTTVAAAIAAAAAGDTIYISGSSTNYGNFSFDKELHIVGNGNAVPTQSGLPTSVGIVTLQNGTLTNASGSTISGLFAANISILNVDNVSIFRNQCSNAYATGNSSDSVKNIHFYNNIFYTLAGNQYSNNILIENNIFSSSHTATGNSHGGITGFRFGTAIRNNLFKNSLIGNMQYAVVANNIFIGHNTNFGFFGNFLEFNTINNNFITRVGGGMTWIGGTNNGGTFNIFNADPVFVSAVISDVFSYSQNYRLQASSPGKYYGTDGTDVGIYGGNKPWPDGVAPGNILAPLPGIPQIISVDIANPVVPAGTSLQVSLKAWRQP